MTPNRDIFSLCLALNILKLSFIDKLCSSNNKDDDGEEKEEEEEINVCVMSQTVKEGRVLWLLYRKIAAADVIVAVTT